MNTEHLEAARVGAPRARLPAWRAKGREVLPVDVACPIARVFDEGLVARPEGSAAPRRPPSRRRLEDELAFVQLAPGIFAHRGSPVVVAPVELPVPPNLYREAWVAYEKLLEIRGTRLRVGPRGELSALPTGAPWPALEGAFVLPDGVPVHHLPPPLPAVAVVARSAEGGLSLPRLLPEDVGAPDPTLAHLSERTLRLPCLALALKVASVDPASLDGVTLIRSTAVLAHIHARTVHGLFHPDNPPFPVPETLDAVVLFADGQEPFATLATLLKASRP
jgi:hypothetical protein